MELNVQLKKYTWVQSTTFLIWLPEKPLFSPRVPQAGKSSMACPHSQLSRSAVCSATSCTTVCALPDAAAAACDSLARSTCTQYKCSTAVYSQWSSVIVSTVRLLGAPHLNHPQSTGLYVTLACGGVQWYVTSANTHPTHARYS